MRAFWILNLNKKIKMEYSTDCLMKKKGESHDMIDIGKEGESQTSFVIYQSVAVGQWESNQQQLCI